MNIYPDGSWEAAAQMQGYGITANAQSNAMEQLQAQAQSTVKVNPYAQANGHSSRTLSVIASTQNWRSNDRWLMFYESSRSGIPIVWEDTT